MLGTEFIDFEGSHMDIPIKAIMHSGPDGGDGAKVPAIPGCFTQAEARDELRANIPEAIEGWLGVSQDELIGRWQAECACDGEPVEVLTL